MQDMPGDLPASGVASEVLAVLVAALVTDGGNVELRLVNMLNVFTDAFDGQPSEIFCRLFADALPFAGWDGTRVLGVFRGDCFILFFGRRVQYNQFPDHQRATIRFQ